MPSTSGNAKIERALNQIVNIQILLGGLPKGLTNGKREQVTKLIQELSRIEKDLREMFKAQ